MVDETTEKHESYGMIEMSRTTSSRGENLFGSSIKHQNTIRVRISPAEVDRHLNQDWFHNLGHPYIEVEMSQSQFAEAITSMNTTGTPCTIRRLNGKGIADCPQVSKRQIFEEEFTKDMENLAKKLETLTKESKEILSKKSITKGDRETILSQINMLNQEIRSNIPFIGSQFNEQMDKTIAESKGEVEAFVLNKIHSLGLEKLKELQDDKKIVEIEG